MVRREPTRQPALVAHGAGTVDAKQQRVLRTLSAMRIRGPQTNVEWTPPFTSRMVERTGREVPRRE